MSFLKFLGEKGNGRGEVYFGRANQDGAPFRGHGSPLLRDHEFEELAEKVYDTYVGVFDTSKPEMLQPDGDKDHGRTLQQIMEAKANNNWFVIHDYQTTWGEGEDGKPVMFVYVVWSEQYLELPQSAAQGIVEPIAPTDQGRSHVQPNPSPPGSPPPLL